MIFQIITSSIMWDVFFNFNPSSFFFIVKVHQKDSFHFHFDKVNPAAQWVFPSPSCPFYNP